MRDMYIPNEYVYGDKIRLTTSTPFTSIDGSPVDPDVVIIGYQIGGDPTTQVTYTYTHGNTPPDPTGSIVRTAVGSYYLEVKTRLLDPSVAVGTWDYSIIGRSGTNASDSTQTEVRKDKQLMVIPARFTIS